MSQIKINNKAELISKIQQDIEELTQVEGTFGIYHRIDSIEVDLKFAQKEIEEKSFTSKSVQRAIELILSILEGVYYDEIREYSVILSNIFNKAFDKEKGIIVTEKFDAKNTFMYVLEIYANLWAMSALYWLIKDSRDIDLLDELKINLDGSMMRAVYILNNITNYYIQYDKISTDKRQVLVEVLGKYLSKYYDMVENYHEHLEGDMDKIAAMLKANEDIARGTYSILSAAIDEMWEYYNVAITAANQARLMLEKEALNEEEQRVGEEKVDFNVITQNLREAYIGFKALQAFYDVLCNDTYELCLDDFQKHLDEALKNAKEALHLIAELCITF
ncbi:hypothetical protein STSV2_12 [Sulfolobus virus STSV2]|uniref:hypothetical protein n=1 Tax=Sulfolobus virus STSV2 TaxID=1123964 RepID=UPI0002A7D6FD|nr:hypothetical protein STSV2_12 [Sulfolobus virus STSV2]AFU91991.1 hypothetical protein STSV2_12 [Sulfolobus virus STSV2]